MYLVYSLSALVVFILVSPYFVYQAVRYNKYIGSLRQRLGYLPISFNVDGDESIWIHAVSVGEALTARALAADLKVRYPRAHCGLNRAHCGLNQLCVVLVTTTACDVQQPAGHR